MGDGISVIGMGMGMVNVVGDGDGGGASPQHPYHCLVMGRCLCVERNGHGGDGDGHDAKGVGMDDFKKGNGLMRVVLLMFKGQGKFQNNRFDVDDAAFIGAI